MPSWMRRARRVGIALVALASVAIGLAAMGFALRPDVARELHTWRLASLLGLMLLPAVVSIVWGMGRTNATKVSRDPAAADTNAEESSASRTVTIDEPAVDRSTRNAETPGRHEDETSPDHDVDRHNDRTRFPAGRSSTPR
ncbi:MAG: hypothetical protein IPK69_07910 [Phycisphaerales bacterium]|nr:MAG: hypothetical protein IPK69_07910 [Phycisphaerales bacterium]